MRMDEINQRGELTALRRVINENLRVQRGGADSIPYIDVANVLNNVTARQNHAVFGRRGCGKTLLLQFSQSKLDDSIQTVYLNCEDFKKHSFPNVLIQIVDALFATLVRHLTGWFGKKKKSRAIIRSIRAELADLQKRADEQSQEVRESEAAERGDAYRLGAAASASPASFQASASAH